jgi:ACT domain-containing protein
MLRRNPLEERLASLEKKIEQLLEGNPQVDISKDNFLKFYNKVKYYYGMNNAEPIVLCIHKRYSNSLINTVLYPVEDDRYELWHVIGELSPVPIHFTDSLSGDYSIDVRTQGTFKGLGIT